MDEKKLWDFMRIIYSKVEEGGIVIFEGEDGQRYGDVRVIAPKKTGSLHLEPIPVRKGEEITAWDLIGVVLQHGKRDDVLVLELDGRKYDAVPAEMNFEGVLLLKLEPTHGQVIKDNKDKLQLSTKL